MALVRRCIVELPAEDLLDDETVLGDGKGMVAGRLAVPAGNARKAVGDIGEFDIERRGVEQIEPPSGKHALPGTRRLDVTRSPRRRWPGKARPDQARQASAKRASRRPAAACRCDGFARAVDADDREPRVADDGAERADRLAGRGDFGSRCRQDRCRR